MAGHSFAFSAKTFKQHPNGLRPDLAQMLADLRPGFVRFPGGCVVEGGTIETATIGRKLSGHWSSAKKCGVHGINGGHMGWVSTSICSFVKT